MNSDGLKFYMKNLDFDEVDNFVVQSFLFEVIFILKWSIYYPDLSFQIWIVYRLFESEDGFKWKNFEL
jgi:hypothetical protein